MNKLTNFLGPKSGVMLKELKQSELELLNQASQCSIELQGFEAESIDLLSKYDAEISNNRTWWFRFNQLPTLAWASGIWKKDKNASDFIEFNFSVIKNWETHTIRELPLKWHDHASAVRMKNLSDWYVTISKNSTGYEERLSDLAFLIDEHLQWLCVDKNYSKFTNHGFEQARFMIYVASELPGLKTSSIALELGLKRLEKEIEFAFTAEGVHKENSPGYQWFMIKVIDEARLMLDHYSLELPTVNFRKILIKAKRFLTLLALPDNSLPLIGDTQDKCKQNRYIKRLRENGFINDKNSLDTGCGEIFDYSASGYLIHRASLLGKSCQTIFKNCHFSDYHKHNDDLSIHISVGSNILFGDGGLYSHNQNDIYRQYARSGWSHSTVFPERLAEKKCKRRDLAKRPNLSVKESKDSNFFSDSMFGVSSYYGSGIEISRELKAKNVRAGLKYIIVDSVKKENSSLDKDIMVSNFLLGEKVNFIEIIENERLIKLELDDVCIDIRFTEEKVNASIKVGENTSDLRQIAVISRKAGQVSSTRRIEFLWPANLEKVAFEVFLRGK